MNARDLRPLSPVSSDPSERGERSDAICAPVGKFRLVAKLGRGGMWRILSVGLGMWDAAALDSSGATYTV